MKKKLIAFDLDGTLLDSKKKITKKTKLALKRLREAGHLVTIATGRSLPLSIEVIKEGDFDHYVLCNGALAYVKHQVIYQNPLDRQAFKRLLQATQEKSIDLAYQNKDAIYRHSDFDRKKMERAMFSFGACVPPKKSFSDNQKNLYQALAFYGENQEGIFSSEFPEFRFVRWHEEAVDVLPHDGSKAQALLHMANKEGIHQEDIIAFGDGENDREMLQLAGTGIVMGNATDDLKKIGDYVTESHDEEGIFQALEALRILE